MRTVFGLLALLGALAATAGEPPPKMKPGDILLTIYTPTNPEADDDGWGSRPYTNPGDGPIPSHALIEQDARREGFAVVKQCRRLDLKQGITDYRFTDVAARLDATTVRFADQTDPVGTRVLEQNFLYDLVNRDSMLKRFIDRPIEFVDARGTRHRGELLAFDYPARRGALTLTLRTKGGGVEMISHNVKQPHTLRFPELPKNYQTRPTLEWKIRSRRAGDHDVVVAYMTGGMAWRADYLAVVNADDTRLDLNGWVTIANVAGATFPNARIKLIAGNVRRLLEYGGYYGGGGGYSSLGEDFFGDEDEADDGFEEKGFFEYHLYTLGRRSTLANNQTKQIEFINARNAKVGKVYTYDGADLDDEGEPFFRWGNRNEGNWDETYGVRCRKTVRVNLEFTNSEDSNLGMPLPGGILRFYKRDEADDSLEFIGESAIEHTPRDETVRFYLGDAFDIVGERVRKDFKYTQVKRGEIRETFEITLRNHKDQAIAVKVLEHLYRGVNWSIEKKSRAFTKLDASSIEFAVPVPARGEAKVTYTVLYWWPPDVVFIEGDF